MLRLAAPGPHHRFLSAPSPYLSPFPRVCGVESTMGGVLGAGARAPKGRLPHITLDSYSARAHSNIERRFELELSMSHANGVAELPDGSGFFIATVGAGPPHPRVCWNPYNKVVQDHQDGTIDHEATDRERSARGLPTPWTPATGKVEVHEAPAI